MYEHSLLKTSLASVLDVVNVCLERLDVGFDFNNVAFPFLGWFRKYCVLV